MGFPYEPCPWCASEAITMVKTSKNKIEYCYVKCKDCKMRLTMVGESMMDCARTWNVRAQRRRAMSRHDMAMVTLLHSDIATADGAKTEGTVYLDNTEKMWELALAAQLASDMDATPVRPFETNQVEIPYGVLYPYLDALVQESAEQVSPLEPDQLSFDPF